MTSKDDSPAPAASPHAESAEQQTPDTPGKKPVKFTLDVGLDLHKAMKIQSIRTRTPIVAVARIELERHYKTSPDVSPGVYPLERDEPTKRITLDLDEDLVIEMDLQRVLRDAKVKDEVRLLMAKHYLPDSVPKA